MRFEGRIKSWNDERGFGFIEPDQGGQEIFVHIKACAGLMGRPQVGLRVRFAVEMAQGKKRATEVTAVTMPRGAAKAEHPSKPAQWGVATWLAIPLFLMLYLVIAVLWHPPQWLAAAYVGASVLALGLYAADKSAAQQGAWRISESTLHAVALVGGWPGALVAQQLTRHKTTKVEFRRVFWATVLINMLGFVMLASALKAAKGA